MIDQQTKERIMDAAQIVDVVSEFVSLRKRGSNYIGCCPFHNEKTPSFNVNPARGIFKCFGCGEGGDAVTFLMKHEHYTYPEALKWLARKYNIEVQEEEMSPDQIQKQTERDNLFHVSEYAQKYWADLLFKDEMGRAIGLSYFHQRGLSDVIIQRFGLGYCKDEWSDFTDHAMKNGYSLDVLTKTGLTIEKEDKSRHYDRFRGRVMFPIYSLSGRVIGFSGRVLSKEKQAAKYVNSPESEIYIKSNALYGIFQARTAIGKADRCYLVEGNVDVVSMHQAGVENTVASCGTALTVQQIRMIRRYTNNVTVLYDGDAAGIKATIKAVNLLFSEGMHVQTVLFPDQEDPDSYAQKYGSEQLQRYLAEHSENFILYRSRLVGQEIQNDPSRKAGLIAEIANTISLVSDPTERSEYIRQCSYIFNTPESTLAQSVARAMVTSRQRLAQQQQDDIAANSDHGLAPSAPGTPTQPAFAPVAPPLANQPPMPDGPPDDLFLPPEYQSVAAKQTLPSLNPAEAQEMQIARLLIRNGATEVEIPSSADEENPELMRLSVAEWIVSDLVNDGLECDNPLYQRVLELYTRCVDEQLTLPDANFFAQSPDREMRNFAFNQMLDSYEISPIWKKRGMTIASPELRLLCEVRESLFTFKSKKLEQRINDLRRQLHDTKSDDESISLINEINKYQSIKRMIDEQLHRVIN